MLKINPNYVQKSYSPSGQDLHVREDIYINFDPSEILLCYYSAMRHLITEGDEQTSDTHLFYQIVAMLWSWSSFLYSFTSRCSQHSFTTGNWKDCLWLSIRWKRTSPYPPAIPSIILAMVDKWIQGGEGAMPPGPVKISHKKDGHQRRLHRFRVSWPPLPSRWIRYCYR